MGLKVNILGIVGSPRSKSNTEILVKEALGTAENLGANTSIYGISGKKVAPCVGCLMCSKKGTICVIKDDFQNFFQEFMKADGIIIGAPVYLMSVPSKLRAYIERLSNSIFCTHRNKKFPRLCKPIGVIVQGNRAHGGQEIVQQSIISAFTALKCVVVSADFPNSYIGVAGQTFGDSKAGSIIKDQEALELSRNLGIRLVEMTKIIRTGLANLRKELPKEYFYRK